MAVNLLKHLGTMRDNTHLKEVKRMDAKQLTYFPLVAFDLSSHFRGVPGADEIDNPQPIGSLYLLSRSFRICSDRRPFLM